jgi:outer membrane receptor protein involved in Fe transport
MTGCRGLLVFVMLALTVLLSNSIQAQVAGAALSGSVADASGAVVPHANVSIKNTATGVARDVTTDSAGFFSAPNLLPGVYDVTVTAPGFSSAVQTGLTLSVGASKALNIALQVGQVNERVEVTASAPAVELTSSELSGEVDATTERELPLNGRDWTQLATLQPGVTSIRVEVGVNGRGNTGYGSLLTISGHEPFENNYRINGISINDYSNGSPGSSVGVNLGVDAIQEFSVLTGNYSAEYGRASGGVINGITKSGTNQFHGDAYYFVRDKTLDARNYFDPATIPPFHRDQFGVSGGAPIIRNKTFIFADYEGIRQRKSDTFSNVVPSVAARAGNLCSIPNSTCTPYSVTVDAKVAPYLAFYPLPNSGLIGNGDTGFFNTTGVERLDENYVTLRVDHHFSDKDSFTGSWFYDRAPLNTPDSLDLSLTQDFTLRQMYSLEETHIFGPNLVNTARFGFSRVRATVTQPVSAINPLADNASFGILPGQFAPQLDVSGLVTMEGAVGGISADLLAWNSFQFYDDAFITHGTHSLKFGFAVEHMQNDEFSGGVAPNGQFNFGSLQDFLTNAPSSVNLEATGTTRPVYVRQTLFGFYAQDDWHVHPNLTLNLGLRYEPTTLPTEAHNTFAVMTSLTSPGETPVNTFWAKNQTFLNFAPRVGFAWDPFSDGKTAVRAGFGIYDVLPLPWVFTHNSTGVLPYELEKDATNLVQGDFPTNAVSKAQGPSSPPGVRLIEQDPKRNYAMNWNLDIQHQIAPSLTAAAAYVGSRSIHSPFSTDDSNMVLPTLTSQGYLWPCDQTVPGFPTTNVCTGLGTRVNSSANVARIRATWWDNTSAYHGLQVGLAKTMSHGFQVQGSYTWSKCIDNGSGGLLGDPYANSLSSLMYFNQYGRHGLCDFNIGQNFVVNYLWHPAAPKLGGEAVQHILGGWEVGGVVTASTGSPFTALVGGDPLGQNSTDPKISPGASRDLDAVTQSIPAVSPTTSSCSASARRLSPLPLRAYANPPLRDRVP